MITRRQLVEHLEKILFIEGVMRERNFSKKDKAENEFLIEEKRAYREMLKRETAQQSEVKIFERGYGGEYWQELHDIEFDGTKAELLEELEERAEEMHADIRACGYDCTGRAFMTGWKVGHIAGNRYKVLLSMAVDV